jgi:type IV pilus assembly protein PilA
LIIGLVIGLFAVVFIGGILAVLGISGTRRYIANAKQAEAKNSLGQMTKDAVAAYERETVGTPVNSLCKSASSPVPASVASVSGKKYQSSPTEWSRDPADAGFTCLKFEMSMPQYYLYDYKASATSFRALASGDLDGDGKASHFEIRGEVQPGGTLAVAPSILETDPDE